MTDREIVREILARDYVSRKFVNWPLVHINDWGRYKLPEPHDTKDKHGNLIVADGTCITINERWYWRNKTPVFLLDRMLKHFPHAQYILDKYYGTLALCGGFYTSPKFDADNPTHLANRTVDLDFFFHSCSAEHAEKIMEEAIVYIVQHYDTDYNTRWEVEKFNPPQWPNRYAMKDIKHSVQIERRVNVTTVVIGILGRYTDTATHRPYCYHKYQFIHRVYPSLGAVIGGFDIGPSMVAYDGRDIWATELGAWSLINQRLIVDISRRSTTFGYRIRKYNERGFSVVIPGLINGVQYFPEKSKEVRMSMVRQFIEQVGLVLKISGTQEARAYGTDCIRLKDITVYRTNNGQQLYLSYINRKSNKPPSDYGDWTFVVEDEIAAINDKALQTRNLDFVTVFVLFHNLRDHSPEAIRDVYRSAVRNPQIQVSPYSASNLGSELELCRTRLTGISWITQNPGRQWTSSINPELENVREFYGETYNRFILGIEPEIETMLRLAQRDPKNVWYNMPRDVFNMIMVRVLVDRLYFMHEV